MLRFHYTELASLLREMNQPEAARAVQRQARETGEGFPMRPPPHPRGP
jgi:hypothetical protein